MIRKTTQIWTDWARVIPRMISWMEQAVHSSSDAIVARSNARYHIQVTRQENSSFRYKVKQNTQATLMHRSVRELANCCENLPFTIPIEKIPIEKNHLKTSRYRCTLLKSLQKQIALRSEFFSIEDHLLMNEDSDAECCFDLIAWLPFLLDEPFGLHRWMSTSNI